LALDLRPGRVKIHKSVREKPSIATAAIREAITIDYES
jgi:hypothetical protein